MTGALAAVRLHEAGQDVSVHERREDLRHSTEHQGRSINLALSTRGLDALDRVGLSQALREQGIPMRGRMLHGRYEVLETLGVGGEARVVRALDHRHERAVALKIRLSGNAE